VPTIHNTIHEATETFTAGLSAAINAGYATTTATATILDLDAAPLVSIFDNSGTEGGDVVFTIAQSAVSGLATTVQWDTANGTASAPGDYTAVVAGHATIAAGSLSTTATVHTIDDSVHEASEAFQVTLSAPVNASLGTTTATGTINDDDTAPVVSILNSSGNEGGHVVFTLTQSAASGSPTTVQWDTSDGTAAAPGDYTAVVAGSATIPAGSLTTTLTVLTTDDGVAEPHEAFTVTLSNPTEASLGTSSATGTINDNDVDTAGAVPITAPVTMATTPETSRTSTA